MLHYQSIGKSNQTLVFLHGYLENLKIWFDLSDEISKNYQVVLIDLPGHGKSENLSETNTMEMMADKVIEVLDFLKIKNFSLCGHSMGGYVTLALAEKYAERIDGFILMNSTTLEDSEAKKAQRLKAVDTANKNLPLLINMNIPGLFAKSHLDQMKNEIEFVKNIALETPIKGVQAALRGMRLRENKNYLLNEFEKPILIIVGLQDETVNPKEFLEIIPNKDNIQILQLNVGHMAYLEDYKATLKSLENFLTKVNSFGH